MNAVTQLPNALTVQTNAIRTALQNSLYPGASDESVEMVLAYCQAAQLDPMTKPVHIVPMWDADTRQYRDVIMPGIGLYRIQAARTGQYAGVSEPDYGPDITATLDDVQVTYPAWCKMVVKRSLSNGVIAEFAATERWTENYAIAGKDKKTGIVSIAPNAVWKRRPYAQLAKCAEAQALRKAFPEIGAQPTAEEMEGKSIGAEHIVSADSIVHIAPASPAALPDYPSEQFTANLPKWRGLIESGKRSLEQIMAMVQSKYQFTQAQTLILHDLAPVDEQVETTGAAS